MLFLQIQNMLFDSKNRFCWMYLTQIHKFIQNFKQKSNLKITIYDNFFNVIILYNNIKSFFFFEKSTVLFQQGRRIVRFLIFSGLIWIAEPYNLRIKLNSRTWYSPDKVEQSNLIISGLSWIAEPDILRIKLNSRTWYSPD